MGDLTKGAINQRNWQDKSNAFCLALITCHVLYKHFLQYSNASRKHFIEDWFSIIIPKYTQQSGYEEHYMYLFSSQLPSTDLIACVDEGLSEYMYVSTFWKLGQFSQWKSRSFRYIHKTKASIRQYLVKVCMPLTCVFCGWDACGWYQVIPFNLSLCHRACCG